VNSHFDLLIGIWRSKRPIFVTFFSLFFFSHNFNNIERSFLLIIWYVSNVKERIKTNRLFKEYTVEIVYNELEDQAEFARYNRFSL